MAMLSRPGSIVVLATLLGLAGAGLAAPPASRVTPVVEAYRKASPAIVNVSTQALMNVGSDIFLQEDDPFEDPLPRLFGQVQVTSLGSGFFIHPDGYIITNAHVVRRAQKITISLADKSSYEAVIVAANPEHDLAVLKVADPKGKKFAYLPLGRSDDLMIGESVIAIGNPFGFQNTLTTGVVSAVERKLEFRGGARYEGLIQVDAPINPGNSGGPLLNIEGQLIGINTAIRADAQGIGFAIPADALAVDLPRLLDFERLNRVVLGLGVSPRHVESGDQVIVAHVVDNSPAAAAEIKAGDRILAVDGRAVAQIADYQVGMLSVKGDQSVKFTVDRAGRKLDLTAKLVARAKPDGAALAESLFGLELREVTPDLAKKQRLPADTGLLVAGVEATGPAAQLGVRKGDIMIQLGRYMVGNVDAAGAALEDVEPGAVLRIGIIRGNVRAFAQITARKIEVKPRATTSAPASTSTPTPAPPPTLAPTRPAPHDGVRG